MYIITYDYSYVSFHMLIPLTGALLDWQLQTLTVCCIIINICKQFDELDWI